MLWSVELTYSVKVEAIQSPSHLTDHFMHFCIIMHRHLPIHSMIIYRNGKSGSWQSFPVESVFHTARIMYNDVMQGTMYNRHGSAGILPIRWNNGLPARLTCIFASTRRLDEVFLFESGNPGAYDSTCSPGHGTIDVRIRCHTTGIGQ